MKRNLAKAKFKNEFYVITDKTDYLFLVSKSSTKEQREKFNIGDLFINAAVCRECQAYVRSLHRHSYRTCPCGKTGVDGGSWYARRIGNPDDMIDVIEFFYDAEPYEKKVQKEKKSVRPLQAPQKGKGKVHRLETATKPKRVRAAKK